MSSTLRRRRRSGSRRLAKRPAPKCRLRRCVDDRRWKKKRPTCGKDGVAARLEALKELIPSMAPTEEQIVSVSADRLFEETADYILLLRTRVEILKQLLGFYPSPKGEEEEETTCT